MTHVQLHNVHIERRKFTTGQYCYYSEDGTTWPDQMYRVTWSNPTTIDQSKPNLTENNSTQLTGLGEMKKGEKEPLRHENYYFLYLLLYCHFVSIPMQCDKQYPKNAQHFHV